MHMVLNAASPAFLELATMAESLKDARCCASLGSGSSGSRCWTCRRKRRTLSAVSGSRGALPDRSRSAVLKPGLAGDMLRCNIL